MRVTLPNVSIIKMENKYRFIGITDGLHISLGVYSSLLEGVCQLLERAHLKLLFRTQLELLWEKGGKVNWNDDKLFDAIDSEDFQEPTITILQMTERQGQYLAFIYYYTKINGQPPAEADMQRYFAVTPPSVPQMVLTLEKQGFIERVAGQGRSIRVLLSKDQVPDLK